MVVQKLGVDKNIPYIQRSICRHCVTIHPPGLSLELYISLAESLSAGVYFQYWPLRSHKEQDDPRHRL